MEDNKKWRTVAVPDDMLEKLKLEAKELDRSVSWLLRHILDQHFSSKK